jgi:hypothetical protein
VADVLGDVATRVLHGGSGAARARAMREVGTELHDAFLAGLRFDADGPLRRLPGGCVLLRLDESTVDVPWELMRVGRSFLALGWTLARQREIAASGHPAAYVPSHAPLRALVVGDPLDNLPGARREAAHVAKTLQSLGAAVRRLLPEVGDDDLSPDIVGIRAKLQGPGDGFRDFVIADEAARGRPGLVSLVGIDSPGLAAALAIAVEVERLLAD